MRRKGRMVWPDCAPEAAQFVPFQDGSNEVENGGVFFKALKILKIILAFAFIESLAVSVYVARLGS